MQENAKIDIKASVRDGARVFFRFYRNGELWYATEDEKLFPVPIADLGDATANINEKAILMMRYMRQWNEKLEKSE